MSTMSKTAGSNTFQMGSQILNQTKEPISPLKMTAEKMQMLRRDVKPGNGTSLLTYQNHASLRTKLAKATCAVDAKASDFYIKEKSYAPERYAHVRHREMEDLRKENNRLFGRLLNIYEVSVYAWLIRVQMAHGALSNNFSSYRFFFSEKTSECP